MTNKPIQKLDEMLQELKGEGVEGISFFASRNSDASIDDMARDAITHIESLKLLPQRGGQ